MMILGFWTENGSQNAASQICEEWTLHLAASIVVIVSVGDDLTSRDFSPRQRDQGHCGYRNMEILDNAMTRYRQNGQ